MNVLIIDDQPDVVEGMLSGINWTELQIKNVYHAYDILRAKEIILKNIINIMLCDIEMPLGSGLDLYEWVAEFYPDIKCIFLTSHEDFSYAQKALRLGSFDYLIQPAPYTAIETAIKKASIQIKKEQKQKQYSIYGTYISEREMDLLDMLLKDYLNSSQPSSDNLLNYMNTISVRLTPDAPCLLFLLDLVKQNPAKPELDQSLLRYIVHNVLSEMLEDFSKKILFCQLKENQFAAVLYESHETAADMAVPYLNKFLSAAEQYLHFNIACYVKKADSFFALPSSMRILIEESNANAAKYTGIFLSGYHFHEQTETIYQAPDFAHWSDLLTNGYFDLVRSNMHEYLDQQKKQGHINQKNLSLFLQDFLQMFYNILEQHHIHAHGIFKQEYDIHELQTSASSLERMHELLDFSVDYLKNFHSSQDLNSSQIDKAIEYIRKNIHQNISRSDIASSIYMNPEYLSRLFKKEKGISLSDYIIQEKLKIAASLLKGTNLSVSIIASNIGYTNFSYFTQVFKKVYGMSPSEYRQKAFKTDI